jgi:integrase
MAKSKRRAHGEGSVFLRKDGRWGAQITLENGKRLYRYGKTQREALEKLRRAQYELEQGTLAQGPKQAVKDYLNYWLEEVHKATLKVSTYALYRRHLDNHIIPQLGHIRLQKLTADQIQAFCARKLKEGLSAGTVRLLHTILYAALKDAVRWKRLAINVCEAVTPPRLAPHEIHTLDQEQARQLLHAAQGSRLDCLLTLAVSTGLRLGEILALRWDDVSLEERTLQVRHTVDYIPGYGRVESEPKTAHSRRRIVLPQFVVEALKQHRALQLEARLHSGASWQEQGLVFPNRRGGYFSRARLYSLFKRILKEAGLQDMRFHDLRHSAATILLSMGVHPKVVQEILGHSTIGTTMNIYSHVLPSLHHDAMDDMDRFFRG